MKRLLCLPLLAALLTVGCKPTGDDGGGSFYVSFLLDGERVELTEGLVEFENVPFAMYETGEGNGTSIIALPLGASAYGPEPDSYVGIFISGTLQAGTYTLDGGEAEFLYYPDAVSSFGAVGGSVTVTSAGAVGETVEGTFSGVVDDGETTYDVTDGTFRVKRIDDDIWAGGK